MTALQLRAAPARQLQAPIRAALAAREAVPGEGFGCGRVSLLHAVREGGRRDPRLSGLRHGRSIREA